MQRIEFSEMTNRLHRNMTGAAALIIGIGLFDLKIEKAAALGIELKNFTTGVLLTILVAVLLYHSIAFAIRAFEEYRLWELQLTAKESTSWGGGIGTVELASQLHQLAGTLRKVLANTGALRIQGQDIFTQQDAEQLLAASEAAQIYAKRFRNFPTITRLRFWVWDIGTAAAITLVALLFAWSVLPSGHAIFCS